MRQGCPISGNARLIYQTNNLWLNSVKYNERSRFWTLYNVARLSSEKYLRSLNRNSGFFPANHKNANNWSYYSTITNCSVTTNELKGCCTVKCLASWPDLSPISFNPLDNQHFICFVYTSLQKFFQWLVKRLVRHICKLYVIHSNLYCFRFKSTHVKFHRQRRSNVCRFASNIGRYGRKYTKEQWNVDEGMAEVLRGSE